MDDYRDLDDYYKRRICYDSLVALVNEADNARHKLSEVIRTLKDNRHLGYLRFNSAMAEEQFDRWLKELVKGVDRTTEGVVR